jgi:hypothetical protein
MSLYFKLRDNLYPDGVNHWENIPQFRLESRARDADDETALEMRIADPLWMLGRQWQFGEFRGEDNGSPISVKANHRREKTLFYAGAENGQRQALGNLPLEARVEAIEAPPQDLRSKVQVGQKFEALIRSSFQPPQAEGYINALRQEFALQPEGALDEKSRRFFNLMSGQVLDGGALWKKIQENLFPYGNFLGLAAAVEQLKDWYASLLLPAAEQPAWQARQLLHRFSVHGQGAIDLEAPDYQSGHLDWHSFDRANIGIDPTAQATDSAAFMPVQVSFAAMPDKRLFAFEDSKLDLAGMEVEPTDLLRLMIIDFSMVSGSDWFCIPITMELGELCWVNHLEVKDVFGVTTTIKNSDGQFLGANPLKVWDAFKIRDQHVAAFNPAEHFLYLAPAAAFRQESRPLEELYFLRDEYANMVWAIEKTIRDAMGKPGDGYELHLDLNGPFANEAVSAAGEDAPPKFRLASSVPPHWIPYLPFHKSGSNSEIELRRAIMLRNESAAEPEDLNPLSWLAGKDLLAIWEEAIPRAGVRVQLTKQRVRWTDGKTYIWLGRKVLAGRGEGSSGLAFDQLLL